jgi:pimeloyl-ACP methyl ester carboxylesterase
MKWLFVLSSSFFVLSSAANAAGRSVTIAASDGLQLAATLFESSARPAPAVLLLHMLGRSKEDWDRVAERLEEAGITALALDLRGHGRSGGANTALAPMVDDVKVAVAWLASRPGTRPGAIAVVGASLGANLAAIASADLPAVHAIGLLSPSLDYRGLRIDAGVMKRIGERPVWLGASTQDPYALRTLKELAPGSGAREQRLSSAPAHGSNLLTADPDLARGLVDWLRRTLIF